MTGTRPTVLTGQITHIIDLAFVLVDSTPVAHNVKCIKHRQETGCLEVGLHQRPGPLSEQRLPSGPSCDLCLGFLPLDLLDRISQTGNI